MREITNERRQRDEQEITKRSEKIFDVVAKDKEKYILQRRQTSTLISARSDKATSIIRMSARWTKNTAAPLASHGVQPQRIDRFWREAIAQQLDRSCTTAAVVARPENAARSAYFFQWQFAARANERRVSSHRVRFALTMTNDDCRTNDEIRTKNDARVPVRHRHTWSSHSSFLIRASGLF